VVLVTPFELHRVVEARYGLPAGALTWRGPYDPENDPLWQDVQAGRLSERDYWRRRAEETERLAGRRGGLREYMQVCFSGPESEVIRPEAAALIGDARAAGLRIGILTNDAEQFHGRAWLERLRFVRSVDAFVDASVTGMMKPDAGSYALALTVLELPADRVPFVDDQPVNVAGAEATGLTALRFDVTDPAASFQQVRERLGLTARARLAE